MHFTDDLIIAKKKSRNYQSYFSKALIYGGRELRYDFCFWFYFLFIYFFWSFLFYFFSFFILFILFLFSFCFHFVHFSFIIFPIVFFILIFSQFISFFEMKQNENNVAESWHTHAHQQYVRLNYAENSHILLVPHERPWKKHGTRLASFSCY